MEPWMHPCKPLNSLHYMGWRIKGDLDIPIYCSLIDADMEWSLGIHSRNILAEILPLAFYSFGLWTMFEWKSLR